MVWISQEVGADDGRLDSVFFGYRLNYAFYPPNMATVIQFDQRFFHNFHSLILPNQSPINRSHPMVYEVPSSKRSIKQNVFEFKIENRAYTVPKFEYLSVGVLEDIEAAPADAIGPFLDVFGAKDSPVRKAIRGLNKDELKGLIEAWRADSDVSVGESEGS